MATPPQRFFGGNTMTDLTFVPETDAIDRRALLGVLRALRKGDFSVRLPMDLSGIDGEIAQAFNDVVEMNELVADEFARIRDEVGKEGQINQRVRVAAASGTWADSIDSVNTLIGDLVRPTAEVARVIEAVAKGNLSQTMMLEIDGRPLRGEFLRIGKVVNTMVEQLSAFSSEVSRVAREVGTEGKLGGQAQVPDVAGTWKDLTDNVNLMAANLTGQVRNIAEVTTAVAKGDLSKKITVDVKGEILELKSTINTMVDQLNGFASEVSRVAKEVGTDGKLGGQAQVPGVAGTWKDLTDNVNLMAANLTNQVRNIAEVTTAVAKGDLSKKITVNVKGEILELKSMINTMVDQLNGFASEVTRVSREVGTEGKLGGQAQVPGVAGTWKDLTDNVNLMAANLTSQVRNIADVTTAVAKGDLAKRITVDVKGEILELKSTINTLVDQLNAFASEVSRVAREVGTDGKLGGQARVPGVAGTWKDLTDNVNAMAANLTGQVRNIADVTTAVAKGDLTKKITVNVKGEILELKSTINTMVDQLNAFASEVTRVSREVGTEGKLGGQAQVSGVGGTWKDLTDNVNAMAANLTGQVRNIAEVTTAVAKGDLSKKITVNVKGEILELKSTINTMVDQLNGFASEVSRVAKEVGTEGKLGGQAQVPGVAGTWKDLTDNVNAMAANLTGQVRNIADVTTAVAKGDLSKKITVDVKGEILELKSTINTMVDQLNAFASEVTRVSREVGTEGKLGGQAQVSGVGGTWKDLTDNVNLMAANLTGQVRNIADVTTAVAKGDLSKKITVDVKGEILELKSTINTMVDQLNAFASEVSRVAREVGTDGKLGGQAQVSGVGGTWKDLTDNVNSMADNLTNQVRGIAQVVTAVAKGDLKRKVVFDAKGEIAALADTINGMIDTLATFGDQVTNVAREVGIEGQLGGQAKVPGAAGLWRDLTDNVNQLAQNLTTQVRAIAEVATAVTKGDLTRSVMVEAQGEVASLKDNINEMIRNLKDTTLKNTEQDWLKTNLAKFSRMLQGHGDLQTVSKLVLSELAPLVSAQQGVLYSQIRRDGDPRLELMAYYASKSSKSLPRTLRLGEGLVGQCALEKKRILLEDVPPDYIRVNSVLGSGRPANVIIMPVLFEGEVKAVIELASFGKFSEAHLSFLEQLMDSIGVVFNTIEANMRTEDLLEQSQSLTKELQSQQEELKMTNDRLEQQAGNLQHSESLLKKQQDELRSTNEELQEKARLLSEQMRQVEYKNREVEQARSALEEKAEQLALSSRYKSEFLANMSHELRTPLNSLLILAKMLADNNASNLTGKQIEYAQTIHAAGADLLSLINDILDLAKIESGTITLNIAPERFTDLNDYVTRGFRQVAHDKSLAFNVEVDPSLPATIQTDSKRLQQILKNLLANAFKFTEQGSVDLRVYRAKSGWTRGHDQLDDAEGVVAFSVIDTGIGIPDVKQKIIFEAFQQADGTTSRRFGGTGLGLSISRELTRLLGGDLRVHSEPGKGSTFTLFLPFVHAFTETAAEGHLHARKLSEAKLAAVEASESLAHKKRAAPPVLSVQAPELKGRKVLIIDDDARNIFALTGALQERGLVVLNAEDGKKGLEVLRAEPNVDLVLMDIMMPELDGYDMIRILRGQEKLKDLPIICVTAKAMKGDRDKCIAAGASDYIAKPVNVDELVALMKVWLLK
jgi:HAMP domain-containing protein/signal transduction histidine kinase